MSITNYTLEIKELFNALSLINVIIDDNEMVQICLGGLAARFGTIKLAILARENPPSFIQYCWSKKIIFGKETICLMVKFSTPSRMREEDLTKEIEIDSDEAGTVGQPKSATRTIGKKTGTILGSSVLCCYALP